MSFRKRGEVLNSSSGGPTPNRPIPNAVPGRPTVPNPRQPSSLRPNVPGRGQGPIPSNPMLANRRPASGFSPQVLGERIVPLPSIQPQQPHAKPQALNSHPGVKPSIITSQPCTSTGSNDLDMTLGHQGLPIGSSLLIEETGTTDFSSTLSKVFMAQGIIHNRIDASHQDNTHEILIGFDQMWSKTLPGVYKGSSRERKKLAVKEQESKVSVSNLIDQQGPTSHQQPKQNNMKIAWRYGLQNLKKSSTEEDSSLTQHPNYNNQFDITSTLVPAAGPNDLTCLQLTESSFNLIILQIESIIKRFKDRLIRIIVPLFLNPVVYGDYSTTEIIQFVHKLRSLLRKYSDRVVLLMSVNLDLYPRSSPLITLIESLMDSVIELKPFVPQLYELMEKVYKNQPAKIKHGHLNIHKLPILSDLGLMTVRDMEYSFKNGRKKFEIEEWSIPVEEEDKDDDNSKAETKLSTKNVDF